MTTVELFSSDILPEFIKKLKTKKIKIKKEKLDSFLQHFGIKFLINKLFLDSLYVEKDFLSHSDNLIISKKFLINKTTNKNHMINFEKKSS
jgi:hypothetical protein